MNLGWSGDGVESSYVDKNVLLKDKIVKALSGITVCNSLIRSQGFNPIYHSTSMAFRINERQCLTEFEVKYRILKRHLIYRGYPLVMFILIKL